MAKLHRSGIAEVAHLRQIAVIRGMIADFERTVQILKVDISTEEERLRVFDITAPDYPILARTLRARLDNLLVTIHGLQQHLAETGAAVPQIVVASPAEKVSSVALGHKSAGVNQGTVLRRPYHEAHYQI